MLFARIPVSPQIASFDFGDETTNSGDMISVMCTVHKGDLPINISWTLNNKTVDNKPGITVLRTNKRISQLSIDDVQAIHAGIYVCTAKNGAGVAHHQAQLLVQGTS